ncbi:MAG: hypothetical protein WBL82_06645 [Terriglobales bacterium]
MDRESDGEIGGELLHELFSAFEDLETQSAGVLQFLKGKGLATDEEIAPYLQQAADASNVRGRAARVRMEALLASAIADAEEEFARKAEERARKESTATKQQESDDDKERERNSGDAGEEKNEAAEAKGNQPARDEKRNDKESPTEQVEVEKSEAKKEAAGPNDDSANSAETDTSKKAA